MFNLLILDRNAREMRNAADCCGVDGHRSDSTEIPVALLQSVACNRNALFANLK
jgi:hypothetical protein